MSKRLVSAAFVAVLLHGSVLCAQEQPGDSHDMSQMNIPAADVSNTKIPELHELFGMGTDGSAHAMHSMQSHHMEMGLHMKMSTLRDPKPGDEDRAQEVVEAARRVAEKYEDYRVALADGYKIFLPNLPQRRMPIRRRQIRAPDLRLDGSRLPLGAKSRRRLVGPAPNRSARGLKKQSALSQTQVLQSEIGDQNLGIEFVLRKS